MARPLVFLHPVENGNSRRVFVTDSFYKPLPSILVHRKLIEVTWVGLGWAGVSRESVGLQSTAALGWVRLGRVRQAERRVGSRRGWRCILVRKKLSLQVSAPGISQRCGSECVRGGQLDEAKDIISLRLRRRPWCGDEKRCNHTHTHTRARATILSPFGFSESHSATRITASKFPAHEMQFTLWTRPSSATGDTTQGPYRTTTPYQTAVQRSDNTSDIRAIAFHEQTPRSPAAGTALAELQGRRCVLSLRLPGQVECESRARR